MNTDPQALVDLYLKWFETLSSGRDLGAGWTEITVPMVDRHNDFLQVYIRQDKDGLIITDDGKTIRRLNQIGCELRTKTKRRAMAETILNSKGIDTKALGTGELSALAINGDFPVRLNSVLMSMLAIGGLANVSPANVAALFRDDVAAWLSNNEADYSNDVTLDGLSKNQHKFDFMLTGTDDLPDRVIQTFNKNDPLHVESFAYRVLDTRAAFASEERPAPDFVAIFSDTAPLNKKSNRSLLSIGVDPWSWTDRNELARKLRLKRAA